MKKAFRIFAAILIVAFTATIAGCGDSDEPNDPSMPESGTWTISSYEDLSIRFDHGSCDREHWAYWEKDWNEQIVAKQKIVITKNTPMEDGWYILSTDDDRDNIGYLHDLEKVKPISVEGKTMTASYYIKQYLSVMSDDDYVLYRATVTLTRK